MVLEPITNEASGSEVDSTIEMLHKLHKLNDELSSPDSDVKLPENMVILDDGSNSLNSNLSNQKILIVVQRWADVKSQPP